MDRSMAINFANACEVNLNISIIMIELHLPFQGSVYKAEYLYQ